MKRLVTIYALVEDEGIKNVEGYIQHNMQNIVQLIATAQGDSKPAPPEGEDLQKYILRTRIDAPQLVNIMRVLAQRDGTVTDFLKALKEARAFLFQLDSRLGTKGEQDE